MHRASFDEDRRCDQGVEQRTLKRRAAGSTTAHRELPVAASAATTASATPTPAPRAVEATPEGTVVVGGGSAGAGPAGNGPVSTRIQAPPSLRGYAYLLSVIQGWTALPWLWSIRQSTLVLGGGDGRILPLANSRILARCIPRRGWRSSTAVDTLFLLQQAREVAPFIEEFLASERPVRRISQPRSVSCV